MARIKGAARADLFTMDPDQVVIPKEGALFDERSAWPVDENLVSNIRYYGQIQPITVRKNGDKVEVVAGRQRLKAIQEINRQAKERGEKPMLIKCILVHGTDAEHYGLMISENEIRRADEPLVKAEKAKRLLKYGLTAKDIAITYGVQARTVAEWLSLTDVAPEVQAAIQSGEIAAGVGVALAELPREQQAAKLAELKAASKDGKNVTVRQARREAKDKPGRPRVSAEPAIKRSSRDANTWLMEISDKPILEQTQEERVVAFVLDWLFGRVEKSELPTI